MKIKWTKLRYILSIYYNEDNEDRNIYNKLETCVFLYGVIGT